MSRKFAIRNRWTHAAAIGAIVLTACGRSPAQEAAESGPAAAAPSTPPAAAAAEESMVDAPWFRVGWPKIDMPEFSWKPWGAAGDDGAASSAPSENPVSRALDRVADSSKRAAQSVRNAWGSAVNKIPSFGSGPKETAVAKDSGPGFFSRFFGVTEEPKAPESVSEFLAQERQKTLIK